MTVVLSECRALVPTPPPLLFGPLPFPVWEKTPAELAEYYATPIPPRDPEDTGQRPDLSPWQPGTIRERVEDHPDLVRMCAASGVAPFDPLNLVVGVPTVMGKDTR